jgi:hypothetical protein
MKVALMAEQRRFGNDEPANRSRAIVATDYSWRWWVAAGAATES